MTFQKVPDDTLASLSILRYCRIGIYCATKNLRKADFSVFRVYFILRVSMFYSAIYCTKQ